MSSEKELFFEAPLPATNKEQLIYEGLQNFQIPDTHYGTCWGCERPEMLCMIAESGQISFCEECIAAEFKRKKEWTHRAALKRLLDFKYPSMTPDDFLSPSKPQEAQK